MYQQAGAGAKQAETPEPEPAAGPETPAGEEVIDAEFKEQ
jgi:hypothetical protein